MTPEQFLTFADPLPEPMLLLTGSGHILAGNRAVEKRLGIALPALQGNNLTDTVADTPDDVAHYLRSCSRSRSLVLGSLALLAEGGESVQCRTEGTLLRPRTEGAEAILLLRLIPKESAVGQFVALNQRIEELGKEIQRRQQAEEEAREHSERLRVTLHSIGDAIISTDDQGRVEFLNPVAEELVGWKTGEAAGRRLKDVFHIVNETTRQPVENPALRALRDGKIVGLANHTVLISKYGTECPIDDSAAPIRNQQGDIFGSVLVFRDITERKQAEVVLNQRVRLLSLNTDVVKALVQGNDLRAMLQQCSEVMVEHLDGAFARIWTLNPTDDVLELGASAGIYTHLDGSHSRVPVGKYKIGLIAQERQPHLTNAVVGDPRVSDQEWAQREGMVAFAGYPLVVEDRLVGVMAMFARHELTEATLEAMASVADMIAVGIDRKSSQERLNDQREWLAVTLASIGDAVITTDNGGRVTFLNGVAEELTGWTSEDAQGKPLETAFHIINEQTRMRVDNPATKVLREGVIVGLANHTVLVARDGTERAIDDSAAPIRNEAGIILGVVLIFRDVTEQRRAEAELQASEEHLRAVVETTPACIKVVAPDGTLLSMNSAGLAMVDVDGLEKVKGKCVYTLIGAQYQDAFREFNKRICRGEKGSLEFEIVGLRGTRRHMETYAVPLRWPSGGFVQLAITHDITERKRAEEGLRLRDRAIQAVAEGILITDPSQPDNPIIFASPGFERITGYSATEALGRNCRFLQGPDSDENSAAQIQEAIQTGRPCKVELLNYRKDGTPFWNAVSLSPVRNDRGELTNFVVIQADVTARKELEEQVRQSQKMEAIGNLTGGLAHDFNNLLTVINGYSKLIQDQLPTQSPIRELACEISQAGERAASLTRQLLAFSRKQVLEPKVLNLNAVVSDTARMLKRLIGEDIDLNTALYPALGIVKADLGQIEQVLINLSVNARDAMPQGGKLTIETANTELSETYTQAYPDLRAGSYVMLAVTDTGTGMDEKTKARIFEPFFTTKEVGKGTGLGLATVFGIVKQSGGHVAVYSEAGNGATFKVYLPRVEEPASTSKSHPDLRLMPKGKDTILLVEDEPALLALSRHILQRQGYTVLEAGNGEKALRIAEEYQGAIHLLMTDVVMPGISGRQVAERITAQRPGVKVLFMSGYTDDAVVRYGVLQAETAFLQKPYTPTTLAQKVREVLD